MRPFLAAIFSVIFGSNLLSWFCLNLGLSALQAGGGWHGALGIFMVLQIFGVVVLIGGRATGGQPGSGMGRPFLSFVMIWNLLLALPVAVLSTLWAAIHWFVPGFLVPGEASAWHGAALGLVFLGPALAVIGTLVSLWQLGRFRIARIELAFPDLPAAFDGLTIAHVSDIHVGKLTTGPVLERVTTEVNRLEPDLILVTGDLINMSLDDLPRALAVLHGMKSRYGLFVCEGNHDLMADADAFVFRAKASGLRLLVNEAATVAAGGEALQIIGLRWGEGHTKAKNAVGTESAALRRLLDERQPGAFPIVLAHHPAAFDATAAAGVPLTLAGHTHGGQLNLTREIGFGARLYRYASGLYRKGASRLVVSNGTGNWFPLRVNAPAEVILLTLRRGGPGE